MQLGKHVVPLQHTSDGPHGGPPPHPPAPPSPLGGGTFSTHCAEWLWLFTSWNGSQNAGNDRSIESPLRSGSTMTPAIQICGCSHFSYVVFCLLSGCG